MPRYIPPKIEERGLRSHLDFTRQNHNDYGYDDFVKMVSRDPNGVRRVNPANVARLFGVDRKTVIRWIEILEKETDLE
jgi:hypothetical protein